jgi:signal transduction histidine kinase
MSSMAVLGKIVSDPHLPTPPAIALKAIQLANQPNCTMRDLGKLISCDVGLSARILKLVNSPLFGIPRAITSIDRALNLLGLKRLRSLVLGLSLPAVRFRVADSSRVKDYWRVSVAQAVTARALSSHLHREDADTDMVGGLLCDLGTLLLETLYPREYEAIHQQSHVFLARNQCALEEEAIGVDHATVTAHVLGQWGMPKELTDAIRFHHQPGAAPEICADRAYILYFASCVSHLQLGRTRMSILEEISTMAKDRFGMDGGQLLQFLDSLQAQISEFASLVDIDVGQCSNFRELFESATENMTKLAVEMTLDSLHAQEEKNQAELGLKAAQEDLRQKDAQLLQTRKMEAVGRLVSGVAHDFNNLLTIIMGYSELLLCRAAPNDPTRETIEQVYKAGERATALTRQLLAFSRKQAREPELVDVNAVVTGIVQLLKRVIGKDVEIVTNLGASVPLIKADPARIEQIIMNLAVNARDAMPTGGRMTIETSQRIGVGSAAKPADLREGTYVELIVRDTGTGMDSQTLEHLFEPFFTTKEDGRGTGLGLATVEAIVKESHGHIEVQSEQGKGSAFCVLLPTSAEALLPQTAIAPTHVPQGTETVLVAEDEDALSVIARKSLEMYGYRVLEAHSAQEALELSREHQGPIHLLICDMFLPQMNGCDLARHLMQERSELRAMLTSGYTDDILPMNGNGTRVPLAFLQKPFTPKALALKVREVFAMN